MTIDSIACTLYSVQCTLYMVLIEQYIMSTTGSYTVHCAFIQRTMCTLYSILTRYSVNCILYIIQCTLYRVQCTVYRVQSKFKDCLNKNYSLKSLENDFSVFWAYDKFIPTIITHRKTKYPGSSFLNTLGAVYKDQSIANLARSGKKNSSKEIMSCYYVIQGI